MPGTKVVFLDVDGTITTYENVIPESARAAIRAARRRGHTVLMCTGRSKAENPPELVEIGFDGMIGGNGSYVELHDEVVMHQHLSREQCGRIVDWLYARGLEFYIESNSGLFASEYFRERSQPAMREYMARKGKAVDSDEALEMHGIVYGAELVRDDVNKISFVLDSYEDYLAAREIFSDMKVGTWGGAGETALFGDVGVAGIDKAHAVRVAVEHLGASMDDTIAVGDAKVDIPMLVCCAVGVAMGSGGDEIRAMADYVTTAVDDDGLMNAFLHLGLIEAGEVPV